MKPRTLVFERVSGVQADSRVSTVNKATEGPTLVMDEMLGIRTFSD